MPMYWAIPKVSIWQKLKQNTEKENPTNQTHKHQDEHNEIETKAS